MPKHMAAGFEKEVLFQLGYGLYALTTRDGAKDNACIVNSVMQVTSSPLIIGVCVNKQNYSCELIKKTRRMNINVLTEETPFELFKHFGFQSGRDVDKFKESDLVRSYNGLVILPEYSNGFISLNVEKELDFGTHILFICIPTEGEVFSDEPSVTYAYYQKNIKGKPASEKKGYVCKVCGYVYEGESLPEDFVCPWCNHGAIDFEQIK